MGNRGCKPGWGQAGQVVGGRQEVCIPKVEIPPAITRWLGLGSLEATAGHECTGAGDGQMLWGERR